MPKLTAAAACLALFSLLAPAALAQGTQLQFGTLRQDPSQPVELSADSLRVSQSDNSAIFEGNVVIGQGDMRISAQSVRVIYKDTGDGIQSLSATGGVTLVSGDEAAEAQSADYDIDTGQIVLRGDVLLTQGPNALTAEEMTVDLNAGTAVMQGRVRTVLQTGGGN